METRPALRYLGQLDPCSSDAIYGLWNQSSQLLSWLCSSSMNSSILMLTFLALLFGARPPVLDADVSRWDLKRVSIDGAIVDIKAPAGYRVFDNSLPQRTYKRAQRLLMDLQYDFVKQGAEDTSQFQIKINLVRLSSPFTIESTNISGLDRALAQAFGHPINGEESPAPTEQAVGGRQWIYYDNSSDVTYGQTRETYGTVVDSTTVLLITGWYGPKLRKDPKWFDSRRQILRAVRDNAGLVNN
jgi:hypothetical protein